jgi:tetratricopeptide (TPR) repeat protein
MTMSGDKILKLIIKRVFVVTLFMALWAPWQGATAQKAPPQKGRAKLFHLQVVRVESREEAEAVRQGIRAGRDLDDLAREHGPEGLQERLGYLGEVPEEALAQETRAALSRTKEGEATEAVEIAGAYFFIRRLSAARGAWHAQRPGSARSYLDAGLVLGELGHLEGEIAAYRHALGLSPDLLAAHVNLGEALRRKAVGMLAKARQPSRPDPRSSQAASDLLDDAIDHFKIALAADPDLWEARYDLGLAYAAQGLLDLTILEFEAVLRLRPDDGEVHKSMASALVMKGEHERALAYLRKAAELGVDVEALRAAVDKAGDRSKPARATKPVDKKRP